MSRQRKKNAKVKDTGRVKYIATVKLSDVFIQVVQLFQRAAMETSFTNTHQHQEADKSKTLLSLFYQKILRKHALLNLE